MVTNFDIDLKNVVFWDVDILIMKLRLYWDIIIKNWYSLTICTQQSTHSCCGNVVLGINNGNGKNTIEVKDEL